MKGPDMARFKVGDTVRFKVPRNKSNVDFLDGKDCAPRIRAWRTRTFRIREVWGRSVDPGIKGRACNSWSQSWFTLVRRAAK